MCCCFAPSSRPLQWRHSGGWLLCLPPGSAPALWQMQGFASRDVLQEHPATRGLPARSGSAPGPSRCLPTGNRLRPSGRDTSGLLPELCFCGGHARQGWTGTVEQNGQLLQTDKTNRNLLKWLELVWLEMGFPFPRWPGTLRKPPHCEGYTRRVLDAFHEDTHPRGCDLSVILQGIVA